MLSLFCYRKTSLVSPSYVRNVGVSNGGLLFPPSGSKRFSSVEAVEGCNELKCKRRENSFAINYLIKSCGLFQGSANSISGYIQLKSSERPDSVLGLLNKHGFTGHQITRVVKSCPQILSASLDRFLLPKLEFISSIGFSGAERTEWIASCPKIFATSLHKKLIPSHNALKSIMARDEIVLCLKRGPRLLMLDVQKHLPLKMTILSLHGVPEGHVKRLIKFAPRIVSAAAGRFEEVVKRVIGLGFDPSKPNFVYAVVVIHQQQQSTWEQKVKVYKSLGW